MKGGKHTVDRVISALGVTAAPVLTSLVDFHVLSATHATDLGAVVAAAVAAYHGGAYAQRRTSEPAAPRQV